VHVKFHIDEMYCYHMFDLYTIRIMFSFEEMTQTPRYGEYA
jgi:hypothetical protein